MHFPAVVNDVDVLKFVKKITKIASSVNEEMELIEKKERKIIFVKR